MSGEKRSINGSISEKQLANVLKSLLDTADKVDEKEVVVTAKVNDKASEVLDKVAGSVDAANTSAKELSKTLSNLGNKSAGKSIDQTGKAIEKSVKKTVVNVSKEFQKLSDIFGSNDKNKKIEILSILEDSLTDDISSAQKKIKSKFKTVERSVNKYKKDIDNILNEGFGYDAKGKHHSIIKDLYIEDNGYTRQNLYDEKSVSESTDRFINVLQQSGKKVDREVVETRERLYSAFQTLKERVNFDDFDFSNQNNNEKMIRTVKQMIQIAKQIDYIDSKIGKSNSEHKIDTSYYLNEFQQFAGKMVSQDSITKIFSDQFESAKAIYDNFTSYITHGLEHGFDSIEATNFLENIEDAAKSAKKEVSSVVDEFKKVDKYISDKTKLEGSAKNAWNKLNKTDPKQRGKGLSEQGKYEFVGQIANAERNGAQFDKDKNAYKYYLQLLEEDGIKEFYKEIRNAENITLPSVDPKKIDEELKKRKELNDELERSKILGADTSGFKHTDSIEPQDVEIQTKALKEYNDEKARSNQLGIDVSDIEKITSGDIQDINARTEAMKKLNDEHERASKVDLGIVVSKDQKSIYELAQEARGDVGAVGDDFNYDRDTLNRYASRIKELQKQIGETTDAKILDDLKKDLKEVQVDFVALYESVNELYDFKLDKKGNIKASTRELYQSLAPQEDIDEYYEKLESASFGGSSTDLDISLKNKIESIKKEKSILAEIREFNDLGDYGEEDSISDKYYNEAINGIKTMDISYESVLDTLTKIRDLEKEQYILHGQMNGLNVFSDEYKKLYGMYEDYGNQIKELEKSLPILDMFIEKTDRAVSSKTSDSDLGLYAKDLVGYSAQAKFELGEMSDVDYANLIQSLSKITNPVKEIRQEVNLANKELVKLGDVYRAVRSQDLEFFDRNPDGTGAIWATSEKDLYNSLYTGHNNGKEYSAEMYARNPLVFDAKGQSFNSITYLGDGTDEVSRQITELYNRIQELTKAREESFKATGAETQEYIELSKQLGLARKQYDDLSNSRDNVYGTHWTDDYISLAKANGYDGLKIENVYDDTKQLATTFAVWSDEQVRNVKLIASGEEELLRLHNELTQTSATTLLTSENTSEVEENTKVHDRNNDSLSEKLQYLKDIQKYSKFMEDANDRKSSMEDKAYDVGGNNPKSEADSQKKIKMYEDLCENIDKSTAALDEFEKEYASVIITMKDGSKQSIDYWYDLDDLKLLKSKISDIKFVPWEDEDLGSDDAFDKIEDGFSSVSESRIKKEKEVQSVVKETLSLFEISDGQLSFIEQTQKTTGLIEEESGQMALFKVESEKATDSAIEGQMHLNDYIDKSIEGQMTLNDLIGKEAESSTIPKEIKSYEDLKAILLEMEEVYNRIERNKYEKLESSYYEGLDSNRHSSLIDLSELNDIATTKNLENHKNKLLEIYKLYKNIQSAIKNNEGWFKGKQYDTSDLEKLEHIFKGIAQSYNEMLPSNERTRLSILDETGIDIGKAEDLLSITSKMTKQFKNYTSEVIEDSRVVSENNKLYEEEEERLNESNNALAERYNLLRNILITSTKKGSEERSKIQDLLPFIYSSWDNLRDWGDMDDFFGFYRGQSNVNILEEASKLLGFIPSLNEESSGQLAFPIEGVKEASFAIQNEQEEIQSEIKETNNSIEGQIYLFDYLNSIKKEEKKYKLANREDVPILKINQQQVQSSNDTTATVVSNEEKQQEAIDGTTSKAKELAKQIAKIYDIRTDTKAFQTLEAEMQGFIDKLSVDTDTVNPIQGIVQSMLGSTHSLRKILGTDLADEYSNMINEIFGNIRIEDDMEQAVFGSGNLTFDAIKKMFPKATFSKNGTISISEILPRFNEKFGTSIEDDGVSSNILSRIVEEVQKSKSSMLENAYSKMQSDGFIDEANKILNSFRQTETASEQLTLDIASDSNQQQKEFKNVADAAEEKSKRIRAAEQLVIDSIKNNEDKTTNQKIKAIEKKILTGQQAIAGGKRTAEDWKIKLPLYEEALRLLKEQKAEEIKISEEKKKQAAEQAKINKENREYESDNRVINQKGLVGDEKGWSYTEQLGHAQTQRVTYKYDDAAGEYIESKAPEYTDFKGLTSAFKQGYETLRQMEYQLAKNKELYGESYDTSALEHLISKQKIYVGQLLEEGRMYGRNTDYAMEYKQFVEDTIDIASTTKYRYQDKKNVDKAREDRSPAYKAASDSLIKLDELRKKLQNSNLDPKDYKDLVGAAGKITNLEQECNNIKTQNKALTKQEVTDLKEKVRLAENEIKARIEANKIATQLTASSQDDAKKDYGFKLDGFIEKLKEAKFNTEGLQKQAIALKETLSSVSDKKSLTDFIAKFKTLGYEFDYEQKKARSNNNKYNGLYSTIDDYNEAQDKLNKLLGDEVKQGQSEELTARIKVQQKEVEDLGNKAKIASAEIVRMFKAGNIDVGQKDKALNYLNAIINGNTDSFKILAGIKADKAKKDQYAGQTKDYERLLSQFLKGSVLGDSLFKNVSVNESGKTTITFLELVKDKAREVKFVLDDANDALDKMQNGDFNFDNEESFTGKWRKRTKEDDSIINNVKITKSISDRADAYIQLTKTEDKFQKLSAKNNAGVLTKNQQVEFELLEKSRKRYNDVIEQTIDLTEEEKAIYDLMNRAIIDGLKDRYEKQKAESEGTYNAYLNSYKITEESNPDLFNKIQDAKNNTEKLMGGLKISNIQGYDTVFNEANLKVKQLNDSLETGKISVEKYNEEIKKVCQSLQDTVGVTNKYINNPDDIKNALVGIASGMENVEVGTFNEDFKSLNVTIKENGRIIKEASLQYDEITGQVKLVGKAVKETESVFKLLGSGLKNSLNPLLSYAKNAIDVQSSIMLVRKGISTIRELDVSLTEMRKVSDESLESLKRFQDVSFDVAGSIGTTAKQIQESSADYMRLGYSLDTATKLAEHANIYANVGDMEIAESTEHMISSIKAWESEFSNEVEASEAIINRYNEIGNNFAITSADIGSAMERAAAALKAGGNTLNESLGLITAGNIIQQDADTTANALKVMSLRIRGSKTELEEMGEETDGLASSTSKLRDEIMALSGVDIMEDEDTYKSTAKIIQEIGKVYSSMSDISQATLLEKLAGKTRASVVAGLLENYKVIDEVIKSAEGADDSALEENQRYLDSIEGKISQFTNEVQEFWYKLISSETVKALVDFGTKAMDIIGDIIDGLGEVGSLFTIITGWITANNFIDKLLGHNKKEGILSAISKLLSSGGRDKKFSLVIKYATESFSREVCEF